MEKTMNVRIDDNGACYMLTVNGLAVEGFNSLGAAWNHIAWMHKVATQHFTVGKKEVPVENWINGMMLAGFMDDDCGLHQ